MQALLAQRVELDAKIAAQRAILRKNVVEQIVTLMREYEIGIREIETRVGSQERGRIAPRRRVEPRYWDPETGATWSGRGRRPRWMNGRDPEGFRITSSDFAADGRGKQDEPEGDGIGE
ncbi:H-NS histone family protein [Burkholderia latens]|uniref:H-NS histone family protein n=1 Tax=Burkholderia latens TaxID=488446 RepID=UPI0015817B17|nr:H-NS histone family protein [Burkholderia latens]